MKLILKLYRLLAVACLLGFLYNCANLGQISGGPKDEMPPVILETYPEMRATNFKDDNIEITFDEFVQLKEIQNQLLVSPPTEQLPVVRTKNKSVVVKFDEELKDSTTYTIYFGDAISDYNEGNPIKNFQFAFSTGQAIDSMLVTGKVLSAEDLKPLGEETYVVLYKNHSDSAFFNDAPDFVGRVDKEGNFSVSNVPDGNYKVYAIKDGNRNYKFDMYEERIAFADSLTFFKSKTIPVFDTLYLEGERLDSARLLHDALDSIFIDTVLYHEHQIMTAQEFELFLFEENRAPRSLSKSERKAPGYINIVFNQPIDDTLIFNLADTTIDKQWYTLENFNNDSLIYWITDTTLNQKELIEVEVGYYTLDTLNQQYLHRDTLRLSNPVKKVKKRKKEKVTEPLISISPSIKKGAALDLFEQLAFEFKTPLSVIDTNYLHLFRKDTIDVAIPFQFLKDSILLMRYELLAEWESEKEYKFIMDSMAFYDIYQHTHDTLEFHFKIQKPEHYGKIIVNMGETQSNKILQLLGTKEEVLREKTLQNNSVVEFELVPPGEYTMKLIFDENNNGKWDTGNYLKHKHAEKVIFNDSPINVRSNWDIDVEWDWSVKYREIKEKKKTEKKQEKKKDETNDGFQDNFNPAGGLNSGSGGSLRGGERF